MRICDGCGRAARSLEVGICGARRCEYSAGFCEACGGMRALHERMRTHRCIAHAWRDRVAPLDLVAAGAVALFVLLVGGAAVLASSCSSSSHPSDEPTDVELVEVAQATWNRCIAEPESPEALHELVLELDGELPRPVCLKCVSLPGGNLGWIDECWDDFRLACIEIREVCEAVDPPLPDVDGGGAW